MSGVRLLALVLARGGSVRLPGKNVRPLGGRPLISWSIQFAKTIPGVCGVLVSTDCNEIAEISRREGASVPWLRPAHLATDSATSVDAAIHALDWFESEHGAVDGLLLLQPTSPFRKPGRVLDAVKRFCSNAVTALVSVSVAPVNPAWCFSLENDDLVPLIGWDQLRQPNTSAGPYYSLNGSLYLVAPAILREQRTFLPEGVGPILMEEPWEALDIDTEQDWIAAEKFLQDGIDL